MFLFFKLWEGSKEPRGTIIPKMCESIALSHPKSERKWIHIWSHQPDIQYTGSGETQVRSLVEVPLEPGRSSSDQGCTKPGLLTTSSWTRNWCRPFERWPMTALWQKFFWGDFLGANHGKSIRSREQKSQWNMDCHFLMIWLILKSKTCLNP